MKKRPRPHAPPATATLSPEAQAAQAAELRAQGDLRRAAEAYKALLRIDPREEWRAALAEVYGERAHELAAKGMLKEAVVIWRNRHEVCGALLGDAFYFDLLAKTGATAAAAETIRAEWPALERCGALPALRAWCSAQILGGVDGLLAPWPADDPLRTDLPAAQAALAAYCAGDDAACETALRDIPFRSPYRDLRPLLKALIQAASDPKGAAASLARLDPASPFRGLAEVVQALATPATEHLARYLALSTDQRPIAAALFGWDKRSLQAVNEAQQLGPHPAGEQLLKFLVRHRECLGERYSKQAAQRVLIRDQRLEKSYSRAFGTLEPADAKRLHALRQAGPHGDPWERGMAWREVADTLARTGRPLEAALCYRLAATNYLQEDEREQTLDSLEGALALDPDLPEEHLRLIQLLDEYGLTKARRAALASALERFPNDVTLLTAAVRSAAKDGAFKKAAGLARRVLELDPINSGVRESLVEAHLAHARKQFPTGKHHLAERELDAAMEWARNDRARGRIGVLRALLALEQGVAAEARRQLAEAFARLGSEAAGHFQLALESARLSRGIDAIARKGDLKQLRRALTADETRTVGELANAIPTAEQRHREEGLLWIAPALGATRSDELPRHEVERWCDLFKRHPLLASLRQQWAEAAQKRWPEAIDFELHFIEARLGGIIKAKERDRLRKRLDVILGTAQNGGDAHTVQRVVEIFERHFPFGLPTPPGRHKPGRLPELDFPDPFTIEDDERLPFQGDIFGGLDIPLEKGASVETLVDEVLRNIPPELAPLRKEMGEAGFREFVRTLLIGAAEGRLPFPFDDLPPPGSGRRGKGRRR